MQLVGRVGVTKDDHKRAIKIGWTVDFELIRKRIPLEFVAVAFQKQDVKACTVREAQLTQFLVWTRKAVHLALNFLPENAE